MKNDKIRWSRNADNFRKQKEKKKERTEKSVFPMQGGCQQQMDRQFSHYRGAVKISM